jgi:hypothetical protein
VIGAGCFPAGSLAEDEKHRAGQADGRARIVAGDLLLHEK